MIIRDYSNFKLANRVILPNLQDCNYSMLILNYCGNLITNNYRMMHDFSDLFDDDVMVYLIPIITIIQNANTRTIIW